MTTDVDIEPLVIEVHCSHPQEWPPGPILSYKIQGGVTRNVFEDAKATHTTPNEKASAEVYLVSGSRIIDSFLTCKHGLEAVLATLEERGVAIEPKHEVPSAK